MSKRKVKPVEAGALLALELAELESSDDSDFRIEDHPEDSDDYSINTDDDKKGKADSESSEESSDSDGDDCKSTERIGEMSVSDLLEKAKLQEFKFPGSVSNVLICAGCLGSRSDDLNEIVECDGCGITVHEGCYGVSDVTSESSTVSSASTEPWFCEACKAGVTDPSCELCPNKGGIFKETEVGAWLHLVCALYVPGVAFSEVERLSGVTLFEMAYSRWGARACALCTDAELARSGVCVGCDAGLCKTFFHVTCGQRHGLLAEAHTDEAEQADPFYAHCKLHSDKTLIAKRKQNWLALQLRTAHRKLELQNNMTSEQQLRIQRKLVKYKRKYAAQKKKRNPPWVPTQKMARMLYSSASAMRRFAHKAECMGVDWRALDFQDSQMQALKDVSRRWHVPPAFSVEFVGYYLERNSRVTSLRQALDRLANENGKLLANDEGLRKDYDQASEQNKAALDALSSTRLSVQKLYEAILAVCPKKTALEDIAILKETPLLPPVMQRSTPKVTPQQLQKRCLAVPTAAALKMGVGFPLSDNLDARQGKVLSTSLEAAGVGVGGAITDRECCVCGRSSSRHLMAACDTCRRHYHLHCLSPPLQRPPKKSKLYGWQCSECDKSSESEPDVMQKKVPRRSRIRYSKDGAILTSPLSPDSTPPKYKEKLDKRRKSEEVSPIKVTIKPFDMSSENEDQKKKDKKIKKLKQKEADLGKKKRSFTSPNLTNTPLMSITPIVADSPNDSHNENSEADTQKEAMVPKSLSFSSLLNESKIRDSKTIESSIEHTLANLSSDIATYKANRKRRKEKHRSRYSPDDIRTPSKHKHKRKKKFLDKENPNPHPRITIKIKPIPKPDGSLGTQMFYVPTESNDGLPPTSHHKHKHTIGTPPQVSGELTPVASTSGAPAKSEKQPKVIVVKGVQSPKQTLVKRKRGRPAREPVPKASLTPLTHCDVCTQAGDSSNLVRCDECQRRYHFSCLEPPLARNPKKRGYSWHCADCDPTDKEDNH